MAMKKWQDFAHHFYELCGAGGRAFHSHSLQPNQTDYL